MIYLENSKIWINPKKINYIQKQENLPWCAGEFTLYFNKGSISVMLEDEKQLSVNGLIPSE